MYGYEWTGQNGIYRLSVNSKIEKEIRPVFKEELDYFGFNEHWTYPDTDAPLLWAEGIRRYILNGTCVAEATGGGFYTKPTIKIYTEGLNLEPIDVDALWKENERLMLGLEKTSIVDECLAVPAKPDKRDLTAIKRLCTAFVKLLYPNATCKDDIPADEFVRYCLEPAKEMRGVIKKQLCIIDPKEFNVPGKKDIPDIQYNYM